MQEIITWIDVATEMPDDDITMMLASNEGVLLGYHELGAWHADNAMPLHDSIQVTHWAEMPAGPNNGDKA